MPLPNPGMNFTPFDPLPASDLNDIVENVEALADGSGLDANSVGASNLAPDAILFGSAEITSSFDVGSVDTWQDITGLSITGTVPSGGRSLELSFTSQYMRSSAGAATGVYVAFYEGATQLKDKIVSNTGANSALNLDTTHIFTPSAGSHTYKIRVKSDSSATVRVAATSTSPAQISGKFI